MNRASLFVVLASIAIVFPAAASAQGTYRQSGTGTFIAGSGRSNGNSGGGGAGYANTNGSGRTPGTALVRYNPAVAASASRGTAPSEASRSARFGGGATSSSMRSTPGFFRRAVTAPIRGIGSAMINRGINRQDRGERQMAAGARIFDRGAANGQRAAEARHAIGVRRDENRAMGLRRYVPFTAASRVRRENNQAIRGIRHAVRTDTGRSLRGLERMSNAQMRAGQSAYTRGERRYDSGTRTLIRGERLTRVGTGR